MKKKKILMTFSLLLDGSMNVKFAGIKENIMQGGKAVDRGRRVVEAASHGSYEAAMTRRKAAKGTDLLLRCASIRRLFITPTPRPIL